MEISNERTPLLGDVRINISPNEKTSLEGNAFKEKSPQDRNCSTSDEKKPHFDQGAMNEVSLAEVVQVMCSAWRQHRQPKDSVIDCRMSEDKPNYEFFSVKAAYAMRLAWQKLTRGRPCPHKPHIIGEAVGNAIAKELLPVPQCEENDTDADFQMQFAIKKNIITADFLGYWFAFDDEDINEVIYLFPFRYIETMFEDPNRPPALGLSAFGRPPVASKFWYRVVELYDWFHDFFLNPKLQLLLHVLLFIWPISFLIIGSRYMDCPIGHHLSHLMMGVGCLGGFATLFRLTLMYMSQSNYLLENFWKWKCLRLIEFTFLIIFFVQAFHFFYINPVTEPDPNQCGQDFYNAALVVNYVSIPLVSVYVFAYSIVLCCRNFNFWIWIIRYI